MHDQIQAAVAGEEAYVVGGAVRDEHLGRPVVDVDVACREPERAARTLRQALGGAVFLLSERHVAWRVSLNGERTVDFTLLRGTIDDDLAGRDFTVNAIAVPVGGTEPIDPYGGRADLDRRVLRAVSEGVFRDDPLRLLRAVRLEDELGFALDPVTEALVRRDAGLVSAPAGERILAELERLGTAGGWRRLDELGLLAPLGGSPAGLETVRPLPPHPAGLVAVLGESLLRLPISRDLRRFARTLLGARLPNDTSAREVHRFRRATEPWALDALEYLGGAAAVERFEAAVRAAREAEPAEPLLRGDELPVPPGPEVGRMLEERAVGTISTREEALELVLREKRT
jgi:poly(A) polymerase-like protein